MTAPELFFYSGMIITLLGVMLYRGSKWTGTVVMSIGIGLISAAAVLLLLDEVRVVPGT